MAFFGNNNPNSIAPVAGAGRSIFGAGAQPNGNNAEKKKTEFWLNVGYFAGETLEGEDGPRFITLPVGIPLDPDSKIQLRGQNAIYNAMVSAQNDLLDEILTEAANMQPGESRILGDGTSPLVIQLRRVGAPATPVSADANPFRRPVSLVSQASPEVEVAAG